MTRNELIALIHIAKNQMRICGDCNTLTTNMVCCEGETGKFTQPDYRLLLKQITAKESTRFMNMAELEKVYSLFKKAGFEPKLTPYKAGRKRTINIILSMAGAKLGPDWDTRLKAFTKAKTGKELLYKCSDKELRMIIGWLRRIKEENQIYYKEG